MRAKMPALKDDAANPRARTDRAGGKRSRGRSEAQAAKMKTRDSARSKTYSTRLHVIYSAACFSASFGRSIGAQRARLGWTIVLREIWFNRKCKLHALATTRERAP